MNKEVYSSATDSSIDAHIFFVNAAMKKKHIPYFGHAKIRKTKWSLITLFLTKTAAAMVHLPGKLSWLFVMDASDTFCKNIAFVYVNNWVQL